MNSTVDRAHTYGVFISDRSCDLGLAETLHKALVIQVDFQGLMPGRGHGFLEKDFG